LLVCLLVLFGVWEGVVFALYVSLGFVLFFVAFCFCLLFYYCLFDFCFIVLFLFVWVFVCLFFVFVHSFGSAQERRVTLGPWGYSVVSALSLRTMGPKDKAAVSCRPSTSECNMGNKTGAAAPVMEPILRGRANHPGRGHSCGTRTQVRLETHSSHSLGLLVSQLGCILLSMVSWRVRGSGSLCT
jgi:hypothetical protein